LRGGLVPLVEPGVVDGGQGAPAEAWGGVGSGSLGGVGLAGRLSAFAALDEAAALAEATHQTPSKTPLSVHAGRVLGGLAAEDATAETAADATAEAAVRSQEKALRKAARKASREAEALRAAEPKESRAAPFQRVAAALLVGSHASNATTAGCGGSPNGSGSRGAAEGGGGYPSTPVPSAPGGPSNPSPSVGPEAVEAWVPCLLVDAPLVGRLQRRCALAVTSRGRVLLLQWPQASTATTGGRDGRHATSAPATDSRLAARRASRDAAAAAAAAANSAGSAAVIACDGRAAFVADLEAAATASPLAASGRAAWDIKVRREAKRER
jgi:hypothetical protein